MRALLFLCLGIVASPSWSALDRPKQGQRPGEYLNPTSISPRGAESRRTRRGMRLCSTENCLELSVAVGFPTGVAAQAGLWNIGGVPIYFRARSGGFLTGGTIEGEFGAVAEEGEFVVQTVSVAGGYYDLAAPAAKLFTSTSSGLFVGAQYGLVLDRILFINFGMAVALSNTPSTFLVPLSGNTMGLIPIGQIGLSLFL